MNTPNPCHARLPVSSYLHSFPCLVASLSPGTTCQPRNPWGNLRIISVGELASEPEVQSQGSLCTHKDSLPHCLMPEIRIFREKQSQPLLAPSQPQFHLQGPPSLNPWVAFHIPVQEGEKLPATLKRGTDMLRPQQSPPGAPPPQLALAVPS